MADPGYSANYLLGKRRIEDNYSLGKSENDYAQVLEKQRAQRGLDQMSYNFGRQRENLAFGFGGRGINTRQSGQYQRAFGDYQQQRASQFGNTLLANQTNMRGLQHQAQQNWNTKVHASDANEIDEVERRAALAAQLRGL